MNYAVNNPFKIIIQVISLSSQVLKQESLFYPSSTEWAWDNAEFKASELVASLGLVQRCVGIERGVLRVWAGAA